ncbi:MAG: hypothetical protein Q4F18_09490 [Clostridia bacterium]|nr:hypothetical protein [Clostridia bacterium]
MREDLLGLTLEQALAALALEGIEPQVAATSAPRREREAGGTARVVYASDSGAQLTVARFLDPLSDSEQEKV